MNKTKPIIGVTGPDEGGSVAWLFTRFAVWRQGGKAVRITPSDPGKRDYIDGLILGGGADIDPKRYGEQYEKEKFSRSVPKGIRGWLVRIFSALFYPLLFIARKLFSTRSPAIDRRRDRMEFDLLKQALDSDLPVLGICRGAQLINIKLGGNLHRDIAHFFSEIPRIHSIWPRKKVNVDRDSRLHEILQSEEIWVNALHHQAIYRPGDKLRVVAREEAGLIQAIESSSHTYLLGVQWHPEYMPQVRSQTRLFKVLVDRARTG